MSYTAAAMAGYQVWSGIQASEMMKQESAFNEQVALVNAQYVEKDAWEAEKFGVGVAARYKAQEDQVLGDQLTAFAFQGVDSTFGTASEVIAETKFNAFLNTLDIQKQARANALGLKIQASNIRLGASQQRHQGAIDAATVRGVGFANAAGTLTQDFASYAGSVKKPGRASISGYLGSF